MSGKTADWFGIKERGKIKPGHFADLVIFDPDTIQDKATFENPHQYSEGIQYVIINGQIVVERGKQTGLRPGKVLSR